MLPRNEQEAGKLSLTKVKGNLLVFHGRRQFYKSGFILPWRLGGGALSFSMATSQRGGPQVIWGSRYHAWSPHNSSDWGGQMGRPWGASWSGSCFGNREKQGPTSKTGDREGERQTEIKPGGELRADEGQSLSGQQPNGCRWIQVWWPPGRAKRRRKMSTDTAKTEIGAVGRVLTP